MHDGLPEQRTRPGRTPRRVTLLRRARRRSRFRRILAGMGPRSRSITLADGRRLGFDDFGDPNGTPVLFFHGFGSSRVVRHPDDGIAAEVGARVIAVDRPGIGLSTRQPNRRLLDWPRDVEQLLDALGLEHAAVLAWSGGGPYALACGWSLPRRISAVGLISAPAPLAGAPGASGYTWRRHRAASRAADHAPWVIALAMWRWSRAQRSDPAKQLDEAISGMVEADRLILGDPGLRAVMIANAAEMYRQGNGGVYDEAICMARPWGFPIEGVGIPVRIWHGVLDQAVPVGMGRYLARMLPGAIATFYPHEGHHFVYDRWREIMGVLIAEARVSETALGVSARRAIVPSVGLSGGDLAAPLVEGLRTLTPLPGDLAASSQA